MPSQLSERLIYVTWGSDEQMPLAIIWIIESNETLSTCRIIEFSMSEDANPFGHDKALACESQGFVYIVKQKWFEKISSPQIRWIKGVYSISV